MNAIGIIKNGQVVIDGKSFYINNKVQYPEGTQVLVTLYKINTIEADFGDFVLPLSPIKRVVADVFIKSEPTFAYLDQKSGYGADFTYYETSVDNYGKKIHEQKAAKLFICANYGERNIVGGRAVYDYTANIPFEFEKAEDIEICFDFFKLKNRIYEYFMYENMMIHLNDSETTGRIYSVLNLNREKTGITPEMIEAYKDVIRKKWYMVFKLQKSFRTADCSKNGVYDFSEPYYK